METKSSIDYRVYCPSYRRGHSALSHLLFPKQLFSYVVEEEEAEKYAHFGVDVMAIPERPVKNIATTRNWILDNKKSNYVIMVDDDLTRVDWCLNRKLTKVGVEALQQQIENAFIMAEDCGAGMWGMNVQRDPKMYRTHCPFNFSLVILGPFSAILDTSLRYDERLFLKEDYDFCLQQIHKHRKVLRLNYLSYSADHQKMAGGCQVYRTDGEEERQRKLFQKKWGSEIVLKNNINKGSINMVVKTRMGM